MSSEKKNIRDVFNYLKFAVKYPVNVLKERSALSNQSDELLSFKNYISDILIADVKDFVPNTISKDFIKSIPLKLKSSKTDNYIRTYNVKGYFSPTRHETVLNTDYKDDLKFTVIHEMYHAICFPQKENSYKYSDYLFNDYEDNHSEFVDIDEGLTDFFALEVCKKIGINKVDNYYIGNVENVKKLIKVVGYDTIKGIYLNQNYSQLKNLIINRCGKEDWERFSGNFSYSKDYTSVDAVLWKLALKQELNKDKLNLLTTVNTMSGESNDISALSFHQIKLSKEESVVAIHNSKNQTPNFYSLDTSNNYNHISPLAPSSISFNDDNLPKRNNELYTLIYNNHEDISDVLGIESDAYASIKKNNTLSVTKTDLDDYGGCNTDNTVLSTER